jgi:hypothetical protein
MQNIAPVGAAGFIAARHLKAIKDTKPPVGVTGGYHPFADRGLAKQPFDF